MFIIILCPKIWQLSNSLSSQGATHYTHFLQAHKSCFHSFLKMFPAILEKNTFFFSDAWWSSLCLSLKLFLLKCQTPVVQREKEVITAKTRISQGLWRLALQFSKQAHYKQKCSDLVAVPRGEVTDRLLN